MQKSITKNTQETRQIGENLAKKILQKEPGDFAVVLALRGNLGAGKTTFLQGFAKGLGIKELVNSPTFVIMKKFQIFPYSSLRGSSRSNPNSKFKYFYHFDCYRLENVKEILALNFQEIIKNPENIITIEWPEKISNILPKGIISIIFKHINEHTREILIQG